MNKSRKFTLSGIMLLWFILLTPSVLGAVEQWFPTDGTTIEYKLKSIISWSNGTVEESSKFEIRNSSSNRYFIPMPIIIKEPEMNPSQTLLETNTEVTLTRSYTELSATQLNRTSLVKGNVTLFDDSDADIIIITAKTGLSTLGHIFKLWNRAMDKSNFWNGDYSDFVDYFDKDTAIGENADFLNTVRAVTDDSIIASYISGYHTTNYTYIADRNGQVWFHQKAGSSTLATSMGADSVAIIWYRVMESSSIPSYNIGIIIGVMSLVVVIIGNKLNKSCKSKI